MANRCRKILHRYEERRPSDLWQQCHKVSKARARFQSKSNLVNVHTILPLHGDDNILLLQVCDRRNLIPFGFLWWKALFDRPQSWDYSSNGLLFIRRIDAGKAHRSSISPKLSLLSVRNQLLLKFLHCLGAFTYVCWARKFTTCLVCFLSDTPNVGKSVLLDATF